MAQSKAKVAVQYLDNFGVVGFEVHVQSIIVVPVDTPLFPFGVDAPWQSCIVTEPGGHQISEVEEEKVGEYCHEFHSYCAWGFLKAKLKSRVKVIQGKKPKTLVRVALPFDYSVSPC